MPSFNNTVQNLSTTVLLKSKSRIRETIFQLSPSDVVPWDGRYDHDDVSNTTDGNANADTLEPTKL